MLFTAYMIVSPTRWLKHLMQLTYLSGDFKVFIIALGALYFLLAWVGEHYLFQRIARAIGHWKVALTKKAKKRKEYKVIQERMLF